MFGIGCSFIKSNFTVPIPDGKVIIHATNSDADINKDYTANYPVVGDAKLVLSQFMDEINRQTGSTDRPLNQVLVDEIKSTKEQWLSEWMPRLTSDETPINPYRVVWDVMKAIDLDNCIVTHESGSSREQVTPFWEARSPRSFIGWGKSTQLGYSLGSVSYTHLTLPTTPYV